MTPDPTPLQAYAGTPCLIYAASRSLGQAESAGLLQEVNAFLASWASHGSPVTGAAALLENRFVIIAHKPEEIAGCSRDSLLFFMNKAGEERGVQWLGGARIFYRAGDGTVSDIDRPGFRARAAEGGVTPDTVVFDTAVRETDAILNGKFALRAGDSWHAKLLG